MKGKETRTERIEREAIQEFGSLVCPSLSRTDVVAYRKLPSSSQYRVVAWNGASTSVLFVSGSELRRLLREDLALEAL